MCGRYRLTAKERWLSSYFNLDPEDVAWAARWNMAPTDEVATIRQDHKASKRIFSKMRWGLIPYWAKDASISSGTINAMSETAAEKPAFREAIRRRRCLVPADGFYEWKRVVSGRKQPYSIGMADDGLFAFAGLWDRWKDPAGKVLESCTILTTEANALLKDIHDRMPVILSPDDYDSWLDPGETNPAHVADLLKPFDARLMGVYPVSSAVNSVKNDGPECALEVQPESSRQAKLF
ncbi:MAG TPA: SOS response-associated peptidase [Candidatus Angelobacter sp.]|nr:SOS response-associated peptidase [Candidatus Angelobacter sp.]